MFQSTYLYKVRHNEFSHKILSRQFQSTYLYKVRRMIATIRGGGRRFQSTYLYKVRRFCFLSTDRTPLCFNPRTYIRYDKHRLNLPENHYRFQSTYLYKVRQHVSCAYIIKRGFNPRTYIRYDIKTTLNNFLIRVSIHVPI